ncbi:MAG: hypothetical protein KDI33_01215 [Halioglobus sp.]|nr:hypothetical protein [Halioglobus sp.]
MIRQFRKTVLATTLLVCNLAHAAPDEVRVETGTDDIGVDFYQQNDFYAATLNSPESTAGFYERQINWMLQNDYPPASIIMSSVGRGMTLADTAYFMSKANPEQAEAIFALAVDIMPTLPGWACSADSGMANRYDSPINAGELPANPTLATFTSLYFDQHKRFMDYPNWQQNEGQATINVDELLDFKQKEIDLAGRDSWWYRPDDRVHTDVIMATLYPTGRRVVIDARLEELQKLRQSGTAQVPVMLLYAETGQVPLSDLQNVADREVQSNQAPYDDFGISASDVIARFTTTGERASPTRDWHKGDHHLQVRVAELQELFEVPKKEDVSAADWQRWEQELDKAQALTPLRMSLYQSAGEDRWLSEPGLVAVAAERQMEALPVVFFYHTNQRQACGVPADCIDHVKEAVQQGSQRADFSPIAPPPRPSGPAVYPPLPPVSPN